MRGPPGRRGRQRRAGCSSSQVFTDVKPSAECSEVGQRQRRRETADGSGRERSGTIAGRRSSRRLLFFFPFPGWRRPSYKADVYYLVVTSFFATFKKYNPSMFCCDPEIFSPRLVRFCHPCVFVFISRRKSSAIRERVCPFWPESLKHVFSSD